MALTKKAISWAMVQSGDLVEFRYKGQKPGAKSRLRTVLILNHRYMYKKKNGRTVRLVTGIQFKATPKPPRSTTMQVATTQKILKRLKTSLEVRDDNRVSMSLTKEQADRDWSRIKNLVSRYSIYRTFSFKRASRNRVVVDQLFEWPKDLVKELIKIEGDDVKKLIKEGG